MLAKALNCDPDWLITGYGNLKEIIPVESKQVPLINWIRAEAWSEIATDFEANEYYPCPEKHSDKTFALEVNGESMSPDFIGGEIIYVDPLI